MQTCTNQTTSYYCVVRALWCTDEPCGNTDSQDSPRPNQTGFVMGKNILDNNFLAQESFEWAIKNEQDLILLLLNFEKAFDKIEWGFVL